MPTRDNVTHATRDRFSRIPRERVVDRIHEQVRQALLEQVFKPGDRLEVEELARMFDVSLTPVRHALQLLNAQGLVEIRPRSGTFVACLSLRDISNNFDIRRALECLSAETAVSLMPDFAIDRMRQLLDETTTSPSDDKAALERHDHRNTEFHHLIVEHSGNRQTLDMYNEVSAQIALARFHLGRGEWTVWDPAQHEHGAILRAAERRDAAALIAALTIHINNAKAALEKDLGRILPAGLQA